MSKGPIKPAGPVGGPGGSTFDDDTTLKLTNIIVGVKSKNAQLEGAIGWIRSIEGAYGTGDDLLRKPRHGGAGRADIDFSTFHLGQDEYLTKVVITYNNLVQSLQFFTSNNNSSPVYGDNKLGQSAEIVAPAGKSLGSIFGRSGWSIDAIDFAEIPLPTPPAHDRVESKVWVDTLLVQFTTPLVYRGAVPHNTSETFDVPASIRLENVGKYHLRDVKLLVKASDDRGAQYYGARILDDSGRILISAGDLDPKEKFTKIVKVRIFVATPDKARPEKFTFTITGVPSFTVDSSALDALASTVPAVFE